LKDRKLPCDLKKKTSIFLLPVTQEGTVTGLTSGMAIAFPLAFVALLAATRNWFTSGLAIVSVGGIVASVLGACKLQGWALGTGEAVAGVMVIGLSVDYTIRACFLLLFSGGEEHERPLVIANATPTVRPQFPVSICSCARALYFYWASNALH
jgi:hypothetical protein